MTDIISQLDTSRNNKNLNIMSSSVFNLFQEHSSRQFIFVEPTGNYGDQLIWMGAQKLARLAGIDFQTVNYHKFMQNDYPDEVIIYIHGGGGFHPKWSGNTIRAFLKAVNCHAGITIQGPQTFFTDSEFLCRSVVEHIHKKTSKKVFVFTRDLVSYSAIKQVLPTWIEIGLDHDTALNLSADDLITHNPIRRFILYAIREDLEATIIQNRDYLAIWLDPINHCLNFGQWVALHNRAKKIVSNRLHSAIAGSVLGVPTTILPNSYHKNRAVWEYSLRQRGVLWGDQICLGHTAQVISSIGALRRILGSSVFQRVLRVLVYKARYKNLIP